MEKDGSCGHEREGKREGEREEYFWCVNSLRLMVELHNSIQVSP